MSARFEWERTYRHARLFEREDGLCWEDGQRAQRHPLLMASRRLFEDRPAAGCAYSAAHGLKGDYLGLFTDIALRCEVARPYGPRGILP